MKSNEWYEDHKEIILEKYYNNKTVREISNEIDCNYSMIYKKFKEWNIERRPRKKSPKRCNAFYELDYNYFDIIDTEHKAYWIGFLLADGFVNQKEISFCLQKQDIEMIKLFLKDLKSNYPIKHNKDGNSFVTIISKDLANSLIEKGFHNRKSWNFNLNLLLSYIPKELEHHLVRGMFDGDGSIKYYKYDYFDKPQYYFGYTGLKNICDYVKLKLKINKKLIYEGNTTYTLVTRDPVKINEIFEYLYKNATIYMDRKYKTFNEIKMMTFNDYNKAIS